MTRVVLSIFVFLRAVSANRKAQIRNVNSRWDTDHIILIITKMELTEKRKGLLANQNSEEFLKSGKTAHI